MAGVTNAPFRALCRRYGAGLYVSEMVMALAVVHKNPKTDRMISFGPDETPRSTQIYGTDPVTIGAAVRRLVSEGRVDHIDLNFGCPARKVTRQGGGAAVPLKPRLMANILRAAVDAALRLTPHGDALLLPAAEHAPRGGATPAVRDGVPRPPGRARARVKQVPRERAVSDGGGRS